MTEIWAATFNKGKIREFQQLFDTAAVATATATGDGHANGPRFEVHSASELPTYHAPDETGETFEENALIKAKSLAAMKPGTYVFAEDSGLVVDGLDGKPGVHSARYAGDNASDAENRAKFLKMVQLRTPTQRAARFKAVIALITPDGSHHFFDGNMEGSVAHKEAGSEGFGYDSVFVPEGEEKTNAELGLKFKNERSHRFEAGRKMLEHLKSST